jgi:Flp pilus assembly protein, pilin Flp
MNVLRRLWKDDEGQGLVEYVLIIAIISLIIIIAGPSVATAIQKTFDKVTAKLDPTPVPAAPAS